MTRDQKRAAIIAAFGIVAIILWLLWRRQGGTTFAQSGPGGSVLFGGSNIPDMAFDFSRGARPGYNGTPNVALSFPGFSFADFAPGSNIPIMRGGGAIPIPQIGSDDASLNMIGACCADCSGAKPRTEYRPARPAVTFVTNLGDAGPTIYNYYSAQPTAPQRDYVIRQRVV